jgi:hypothetical protein
MLPGRCRTTAFPATVTQYAGTEPSHLYNRSGLAAANTNNIAIVNSSTILMKQRA